MCLCKGIKYLDIFPDQYLFPQSNKDISPALKEMKRIYHQRIFLCECVDGILNYLGITTIDVYDYFVEFVETVWSDVNAELSHIKLKSRHLKVDLGKYGDCALKTCL